MIIIRKDTVWGAGTKILTDDVQIAAGANLTILPGSQIVGNGYKIESYGNLVAKGTPADPIFLDNVRMGLSNDIYASSKITIDYAHVNSGSLSGLSTQIWGAVRLTNSILTGLTESIYNGYDNYAGRSIFSDNIFLDSHGIQSSSYTSPIISGNLFDRYDTVIGQYGFAGTGVPILSSSNHNGTGPHSYDNAFLVPEALAIKLEGDGIIDSQNDWFGTTNKNSIQEMIYDNNDDLGAKNTIDLSQIAKFPSPDITRSLFSFTSIKIPQDIVVEARLLGNKSIDLTGNKLDNKLIGNSGDNTLDGGLGADTMSGGAGDDTYVVDNARDTVLEYRNKGTDSVVASVSYTLANNVENLTLSGTRAINAIGNALANRLVGNGAANILDGKGGADRMEGGAGNDTYYVDHAGDRVFEAVGEGRDTVVSTVSYALAADQAVETLQFAKTVGKAALNLSGNAFANTLVGSAGDNVLNGGGGADAMYGGTGNDTYVVDNAKDTVSEAKGAGRDSVLSSVSYALKGGQEVEILRLSVKAGSANLTGNEFGQSLVGNAGANVLDGGLGADVMTGGRGADTFVFATKLGTGNVDHITDFATEDTIRLSKTLFKALAPGQLTANEFKDIAKAKIDADDHILYDSRNGSLFYDADGSGKAAAVKFAILDTKAAITHADFLIG